MKPVSSQAFWQMVSAAAIGCAATLAACGGGGSSDGGTTPTALAISGTAAIGAPISGQTVEVKCAVGTASGTTNADGSYSLNVSGGSWPCVVRVSVSAGAALHTVATAAGTSATANVTPATQLIVANLAAVDPEAYYTSFDSAAAALITASAVATAQSNVIAVLQSAGVDFSSVGDLLVSPLAAASAYDAALEALAAALTQSATTLDTLTTAVINMAGNSVPSLPADLLLQPAAANCAAMRSGTYRIVTPTSNATMADQSGLAVFDATTLAITRPDGGTGTWVANGPCRFTDQGGSYIADIVVSQAGVLTARYTRDNGITYRNFIGFPEQARALTELAATWNVLGMSGSAGNYVGSAGSITFDGAGKARAASTCQNNSTWAIDVCADVSPAVLDLAPALTVDADGGFDAIDATTHTVDGRVFAFKAGSGDLMLVSVNSDGRFFFYAPQRAVALPNVGAQTTSWNFDVLPQLTSAQSTYETHNTVTAVDATADSWVRTQKTVGKTNDHAETLHANSPRIGYTHRPAGTATAVDGTTVTINEFTAIRMPGMGISPLLLLLANGSKLFEFSVVEP